ncbi:neuronal acetylcholine receptor subunit alpha-5-like [Dreissena polymorpha]|uniref:Uncharacterized protein n=1 Tax=Dreissena polymorpha TaxID=45954 RepID=A0A9D4RZ93_DREPO|nr:neuronal acetylcholine receptor subunit alpha-5-like [Dreissena polymorpha]KAH3884087.1 hypothetical protein DPMN_008060 [Dreissena polymorpha]
MSVNEKMFSVKLRSLFICFYFILEFSGCVNAVTFDDVKEANLQVVAEDIGTINDNNNLRPISDSDLTLSVNVAWNLVSINDFDEANGYIEVSGYLKLEWVADIYTSNTKNYDGSDTIKYDLMWKPPIMILNSLSYFEEIGHAAKTRIRFHYKKKTCTWMPWVTTRVGCSPDVKFYPFDTQKCVIKLAIWGYPSNEVNITPSINHWTFKQFDENGEWEIRETNVESTVEDDVSMLSLGIKIKRRPMYYIINIITPVIILGVLNSFAFILPTESGERVGFAVTCYLSYVVLLNMIMGFLPSAAAPMSLLSYYTFIMMVFSGAMAVTTILTVRIYHKDKSEKVPIIYQSLFSCIQSCKKACKNTHTVEPFETHSSEDDWSISSNSDQGKEVNSDQGKKVTWPMISGFLDWLFFFGFLGGQIFFSVGYLVPIFLK